MSTASETEMRFGEYIESLRKERGKSLRATAAGIGVTPQYYSDVEKGRSASLTAERLDNLKAFLNLPDEQAGIMYNKAAEERRYRDTAVPQDFSTYIVERDYAMAALRVAKELNADVDDWRIFVEDLKRRRGMPT